MQLTFPIIVNNIGGLDTTTDYDVMWRQRVTAVLATLRGTRAMRSSWGCDAPLVMFETYSVAEGRIRSIVGNAFNDHLRSLTLVRVDVSEVVNFDGSTTLIAEVWYRLPTGTESSLTMPVSQDMYGVVQ